MQRVVVLGGSGFVGRALCRQLATQRPGLRVTVPTRQLRQAAALRTLPAVDVVTADVHDPVALQALLAGADAVVNLVAILHGTAADFDTVHVALPRRLAAACRASGVPHLVHVSALGVSEQAPSNYLRSKAAGEAALQLAAQQGGLRLTLLRPSVIFGAEDRFLNLFARLLALAPLMPLAGADARFQPVWVEDVARALVLGLQQPLPPLVECAGPQVLTLRELVQRAGRWAGHPRPVLPLPAALGRLQALLLEQAPGPTLMSRDNLLSMQVPNVASGALPGLAELGLDPAAVDTVMPEVLARRGCRSHLDALRRHAGR